MGNNYTSVILHKDMKDLQEFLLNHKYADGNNDNIDDNINITKKKKKKGTNNKWPSVETVLDNKF